MIEELKAKYFGYEIYGIIIKGEDENPLAAHPQSAYSKEFDYPEYRL